LLNGPKYPERMRRRFLNGIVALLVVLAQFFLIAGTKTSFADTSDANQIDYAQFDFTFGPVVICTPTGIKVIYPGDTETGDKGGTWVKCPLCLAATSPFLIPVSFDAMDLQLQSGSYTDVCATENEVVKSAPRYVQRPVRAPPFGSLI